MERRTAIGAAVAAAITAVGAVATGLLAGGGGGEQAASTTTTRPRRTTTSASPGTTTTTKPRRGGRAGTSTTQAAGQPGASATTTQPPSPTTTAAAVLVWPQIARVADVPVGGSKAFTFRGSSGYAGSSGILLQPSPGTFRAFGPCTHQFGPLRLEAGSLVCQWHGSRFAPGDGSVTTGPATDPLGQAVLKVSDGVISYVRDA